VIILQLLSFTVVPQVTLKENAVSKLSALSRHESLVQERRLLRAIGRSAGAKSRLSFGRPQQSSEAPRNELAPIAAPSRKLKGLVLRPV
jgi:hypothetical protein